MASLKTDQEILQAFGMQAQKHQAFEWLLAKYQQKTYWHIRRIVISHDDADDVCQNTLIKIWENLTQFKGEAQLYTWIYRIATNEALAFLNKKKQHLDIDATSPELLHHLTASHYFDGNAAELKLQQAILTLPEKQRVVFNLKYFDQMKYEEMSEVLETSVGALKASYHHAVKKIEEFVTKA